MNFYLFLTWSLCFLGHSSWAEPQIECLQREHENHGMKWRKGLTRYAQIYADEAKENKSYEKRFYDKSDMRIEMADKPLRVCYSRLYVNFIETCSLYMLQRMDKIRDFKDKGARFGCAISTSTSWISVCCIYKISKKFKSEM